jgi:hypothetical protein
VIHTRDLRDWSFLASLVVFFLLPAITPSAILSFVKMQNKETGIKLVFWKKLLLGTLGGILGEVAAIAMYHPAESKWCSDEFARGSYCDGQGPLILVLTVPLFAILASCVSMLWTWYSLSIPASSRWASVFSYSGKNRALNAGFALAVQAVYWTIFTLAVYRLSRSLL